MAVRDDLKVLLMARNDIIYLVTFEEHKAQKLLKELVDELNLGDFWTWSVTDGVRRYDTSFSGGGSGEYSSNYKQVDFFGVIEWVEKTVKQNAVIALRGFNQGFSDMTVRRRLLDYCLHRDQRMENGNLPYTPLIIIASVLDIPQELEKEIAVVDMGLPTHEEIMARINTLEEFVKKEKGVTMDAERKESLAWACQGLSDIEIESALARSMAKSGELSPEFVKEFKRQSVRKNGQVDIVVHDGNLDDVGGNDLLKAWVKERAGTFMDPKALAFGCAPPKGLLLLGHPGTGKSLSAKTIAATLELDLLRWDLGRSFKGFVGSTENSAYEVLKLADAVAPVVLWIDEIEKGLSGTGSSNMTDGGTTNRFYQLILTWLQEHTTPVLVLATANDVLQLPDALMRAGRFDKVFWVDLPAPEEREEIFGIHLRKRKRDPEKFDLKAAAKNSNGFSGAEIEQVVQDAITTRYYRSQGEVDVTTEDLLEVAAQTKPLSVLRSEDFAKMRLWAKEHAKFASSLAEKAAGVVK